MSVTSLELSDIQPRRERSLGELAVTLPQVEDRAGLQPFSLSNIIQRATDYQHAEIDVTDGKETINDFNAVAVVLRELQSYTGQNPEELARRQIPTGTRSTTVRAEFPTYVDTLISGAQSERLEHGSPPDGLPTNHALNQIFLATLAEASAGLQTDRQAVHKIVSFFTTHTDQDSRLRATTALIVTEMRARDKLEEARTYPPYQNPRITHGYLEHQKALGNPIAGHALHVVDNYGGTPREVFTNMINYRLHHQRRGRTFKDEPITRTQPLK